METPIHATTISSSYIAIGIGLYYYYYYYYKEGARVETLSVLRAWGKHPFMQRPPGGAARVLLTRPALPL